MMRHALLLLALLPLAACKDKAPAAVNADPAAATAQAQTKAASAEDPQRAAAAEANVKAAAEAAAKAPPPVEGTDFVSIPNGQPFDTAPGKIEIVEFFGYVCPFCAAVQPTVSAMKAKLPPDVHFVEVPAAFGGPWDNYAKAFYAAEAMGLHDKTHDAMFRAIHVDQTLKGERGMDWARKATVRWCGGHRALQRAKRHYQHRRSTIAARSHSARRRAGRGGQR
ncbi:MAG TPA: hypothetical protein PKV60_09845 [Thermomonas sp.]|nr:hypothetical protein [Thermomonas sp.]